MIMMEFKYESPIVNVITMESEGLLAASVTNECLEWESEDFVM